MFRILITSAVYTWHFVYLTVLLFFCYFSSKWLLLAEWSTASYKRQMTERWDSEMEERRRRRSPAVPLTDRGEGGHATSVLQSVVGGLWRGDRPVLFTLPCLDGEGGGMVVGLTGWLGGLISLFWHCLWWSKWSSTTLAHLADEGEDANVSLFSQSNTDQSKLGSAALRASNSPWWEVP